MSVIWEITEPKSHTTQLVTAISHDEMVSGLKAIGFTSVLTPAAEQAGYIIDEMYAASQNGLIYEAEPYTPHGIAVMLVPHVDKWPNHTIDSPVQEKNHE
ncbi:MAG: hypothetical protein WCW93_03875 [Candidatus Paceibacterota bacterium]|jgi:hypothetical protein